MANKVGSSLNMIQDAFTLQGLMIGDALRHLTDYPVLQDRMLDGTTDQKQP